MAAVTTAPSTWRTWRHRRRRTGLATLLAALLGTLALAPAGRTGAHEEIAGSDPEMGARLDEPITEVTIDFGTAVSDDLELALLYDTGGGDSVQVDATVSHPSAEVGRLEFAPLERKGRYFVRYLATVPVDGHSIAGSILFDYGAPRSSGAASPGPWIAFGLVSVVILGLGAWLSLRRHRALAADDAPVEDRVDGSPDSGVAEDVTR
jgi:methionine-rich copper-binding protein CopC